ncbi:MAG: iron-regulated protein [Bacteroidetes bacterium]|nr:MAG: iron-regulated protein [Bacteroidota bacterium]
MKILHFILFSLLFTQLTAWTQDQPAYVLYDSKGKKIRYQKMLKQLEQSQVVLFGELHNNPISHWLQLEVTQAIHAQKNTVLGAEMFERDNQDELNGYLEGSFNAKVFDTLARLWNNYYTDYAPLVDFAKENQLPFIATNIPRRFANMVYKKDFSALDELSSEEKSWVAPLPIPYDSMLPRYQNILKMMGGHGTSTLIKAQATKDATMAHFIVQNLPKEGVFIHYNGAYHSDYYEGILWYLNQYKPGLHVKTISTVSQADIHKLEKEHLGRADFIICVDEDMTSTY